MEKIIPEFLRYLGNLLLLTLGVIVVCGLAAWLAERLFVRLSGVGKFVYVSSIVGTPVHELGHAIMCVIFMHKITEMRLLLPPGHPSGTLGYVSHSFHPKNLWARLGNLFIGVGPIFSGLGVMILMLVLCFPNQWSAYVETSNMLVGGSSEFGEIVSGVFSLLLSMPAAFADCWWQALIGLAVILFVSQHITLSGADIKGALSAIPLYVLLLAVVAGVTMAFGVQGTVLAALHVFNLWLLSLFSIAIAFSLVWILIALVIWVLRRARHWF
ncbi:MAG: hypothetical protein IJX80_05135 [Clostridia bacterium]|nr:hypothetical protein [Clostridia bacterium]